MIANLLDSLVLIEASTSDTQRLLLSPMILYTLKPNTLLAPIYLFIYLFIKNCIKTVRQTTAIKI